LKKIFKNFLRIFEERAKKKVVFEKNFKIFLRIFEERAKKTQRKFAFEKNKERHFGILKIYLLQNLF